ncbi:MAG: ParA family protein [Halobacteriaceae archaeon]
MAPTTAAVVGAAGGVGATRLTVEVGATLARDGRDVALLDTALATQGLARFVSGQIEPDSTALVLARADGETAPLADATRPVAATEGRLVACPAYAPFERLARAEAPAAARAFESVLADAAGEFDHVLVDTPPVATNQAVAAVTATDRRALVTLPGGRGGDALQRARGRLADLSAPPDVVVHNRATEDHPDADIALPESDTVETDAPTCLDGDGFAPAVAALAETLFDTDLDIAFAEGLVSRARRRFGE